MGYPHHTLKPPAEPKVLVLPGYTGTFGLFLPYL